jgi:hypothetical protein
VHETAVPPSQVPAAVHFSPYVQALPSLQAIPVFGVTAHDAVPLQLRVLHGSVVHTTAVPPSQVPAAVHFSPYVQSLPSLHVCPRSGVTAQVAVPLHVRMLHVSLVHTTGVPASQVPAPLHVSPKVQALPSLHA